MRMAFPQNCIYSVDKSHICKSNIYKKEKKRRAERDVQ